jgi:hypothetical protein
MKSQSLTGFFVFKGRHPWRNLVGILNHWRFNPFVLDWNVRRAGTSPRPYGLKIVPDDFLCAAIHGAHPHWIGM